MDPIQVVDFLLKRQISPAEAGCGCFPRPITPRLKPGAKTGRLKPAKAYSRTCASTFAGVFADAFIGSDGSGARSYALVTNGGYAPATIDSDAPESNGTYTCVLRERAMPVSVSLISTTGRTRLTFHFNYHVINDGDFPASAGSLFAPGFSRGVTTCASQLMSRLQPGFVAALANPAGAPTS